MKLNLDKVKEVRPNFKSKAGHPIYDFMTSLGDGCRHCSTCNCHEYVTHNGFSMYTENKSVYSQWQNLNHKQLVDYARKHPEYVIDSRTITPEHEHEY